MGKQYIYYIYLYNCVYENVIPLLFKLPWQPPIDSKVHNNYGLEMVVGGVAYLYTIPIRI